MKKLKSTPIFDDSDFPISAVRKSIFQGTGVDMEEAIVKPIIAIANSQTDINPGHMHLSILAQRVKEGIHAGGGLPYEFNVPAPCDGMTEGHEGMRFVLAQRDLIADIIESHVRSMCYDAIVFVASCDKIVPGMLIAAARLNLPSIFLTGGPNCWNIRFKPSMKGSVNNKDYDNLSDLLSTATAATSGACEIMGTANTMQCLTEALGMALPGSANVPAYHSEKLLVARKTGKRIVEMVEEELTAQKIMTAAAIDNAVVMNLAIGGSTNSTLHLPAIAHELGFELPLERFNDFNKKIPTLLSITPNGPHGVVDLYVAGGMPAVMKEMQDDLNTNCISVSGQPLKKILDEAEIKNRTVIPERSNPYKPEGGTVILSGNLAAEGAVVKQSAVKEDMRVFRGPARVFEAESEALKAIRENSLNDGEVIIIRNEGPKGGPGMPETLAVTMGIEHLPVERLALVTDGRFSGATSGPCVGHVSPEAAVGGPIAVIRDGDEIIIDIPARKLSVNLPPEEIQSRLKSWKPVRREIPKGYMHRYIKMVSSAARGAILE